MFAILGKFLISSTVVLMTSQQGLTMHINVFIADQILIGRCFKGFEWSWYFEGQTEYSFECKMISGCLDKNIAWPLLWRDMHIYKIEDGGHFIPFDQNICRSKQEMKKTVKECYYTVYSLKRFFKWEN
jgi:hypothetical protein